MAPLTWLDKLEQELNIDIDWMAPDFIQAIAPTIRFHDQTSNQLWVDVELGQPYNADLLRETARELKDQGWLAIYTRMSVLLCKKNISYISGRVLLQTLPSSAYDTAATVAHAKLYDAEFQRVGIGRDQYCIKIPSTGPALNAARILQQEGIQTLGTALFGVPQAVACSQAGCLYISPYFNDVRAHDNRELWPNVADPALLHPNSPRVLQILETYRRLYKETGKQQPLVKNASLVSAEEAMAAGEMGCHSATLFHTLIQDLAARPYDASTRPGEGAPKPADEKDFYRDVRPLPARLQPLLAVDPLSADQKTVLVPYETAVKTDYLADGGKALDAAILADPTTADRLAAALAVFVAAEDRSRAKVETALATL